MQLRYLDEIITSPDGIACRVLDVANVDFNTAVPARKTALTLVRCAAGGEAIETRNAKGQVESVYTAKAGDAIFINLHNPDDMYVPGNADGTRWQFRELSDRGYSIVGDSNINGGVLIRNDKTAPVLHECVQEPTCIKNAWGEGQHQFLFKDATLKLEGGKITGIAQDAFNNTWEALATSSAQSAPHSFSAKRPPAQ